VCFLLCYQPKKWFSPNFLWHLSNFERLLLIVTLGPVPRDQGIVKVLEYLASMVDYETCVKDALSYLLEVAKSEEGLQLDAR